MNNDPKLKLAMARLLPEKICIAYINDLVVQTILWKPDCGEPHTEGFEELCVSILETEWLYVMHLVEQTLTAAEEMVYAEALCAISNESLLEWGYYDDCYVDWSVAFDMASLDFNQRATAMCKVKGIEI